jgi:hypothetical protein
MLNSLIGIIASSGGGSAGGGNSYESIASTTVGSGGASSVTFSSIPQTYAHLQIRILARGTNSQNEMYIIPQINSVTGTNYTQHVLTGDGSSASAAGSINDTPVINRFAGANATADIFGMAIVDFLDYTNADKKPVMRSLGGVDRNGAGQVSMTSTMIQTNGAITDLVLRPHSGNFVQYSQFALYGIKG